MIYIKYFPRQAFSELGYMQHYSKISDSAICTGIGRALCTKLHAQGANVYALCVNQEWLTSLASECPGIQTVCVDLLDWDSTRKAVTALGPMNCLVNNAGIGIQETFMNTTPEGFDKYGIRCRIHSSLAMMATFSRTYKSHTYLITVFLYLQTDECEREGDNQCFQGHCSGHDGPEHWWQHCQRFFCGRW